MGAVVLSITGAEALYADMGHFGPVPIRRAWFFLVFPCLTLNYLGQGALIVQSPKSISNPFYLLAPGWAQIPLVILATLATVIASQAVISGAYSVSRQAARLGYLPRMTVRQTSQSNSGQIYIPAINWALYAGVMVLLVLFRSSAKLATAYGLAVTGTFLITTTLFLVYAHSAWAWPRWKMWLVGIVFGALELTYFAANLTKVLHGGWLPLLIALAICTVMFTWRKGSVIVTERRIKLEGPMQPFLDWLHTDPVTLVPGTAIFLHPDRMTVPLAFQENANFNHVIHENVFIVSTVSENIPHVAPEDQVKFDDMGDAHDSISHITLHYGFQDDQNVPEGLQLAAEQGVPIAPDEAYYYVSRITLHATGDSNMSRWRKRGFLGMAHNAASPVNYYRLPVDRTVVMGAQLYF